MQKLQIGLLGLPVSSKASERNDPIEPCIRSAGGGALKLAVQHQQSNASHAGALLPPRSLHDMSAIQANISVGVWICPSIGKPTSAVVTDDGNMLVYTFATMPLLIIRLHPIKSLVPKSSLGYRRTYWRQKC
jgi:hypothetical protein